MADKQTDTGARGRGNKSPEGHRDASTNNPVSAKNRSLQKKAVGRNTGGRDAKRAGQTAIRQNKAYCLLKDSHFGRQANARKSSGVRVDVFRKS